LERAVPSNVVVPAPVNAVDVELFWKVFQRFLLLFTIVN
jgi:hypothetical protein